jgi:hypothetical protein
MSAEPKRVELTEAEREALFRAGDHHPDHCDCTAFADEVGYAPGSETCDALADTYDAVTRIKAAARREALLEVRRSVAAIRTPLNNLVGLSRAQAFHVGVGEVATLLDNTLLAEPERDEESGR